MFRTLKNLKPFSQLRSGYHGTVNNQLICRNYGGGYSIAPRVLNVPVRKCQLFYDLVQTSFIYHNSWGMSMTIDCKNCNPDFIRDPEKIKQYVEELCRIIDMKRYGDCNVVYFGEDKKVEGYSMTQFIETSLISGHFANETNTAYIDLFSCKMYNPQDALNFTKDFFQSYQSASIVSFR